MKLFFLLLIALSPLTQAHAAESFSQTVYGSSYGTSDQNLAESQAKENAVGNIQATCMAHVCKKCAQVTDPIINSSRPAQLDEAWLASASVRAEFSDCETRP